MSSLSDPLTFEQRRHLREREALGSLKITQSGSTWVASYTCPAPDDRMLVGRAVHSNRMMAAYLAVEQWDEQAAARQPNLTAYICALVLSLSVLAAILLIIRVKGA